MGFFLHLGSDLSILKQKNSLLRTFFVNRMPLAQRYQRWWLGLKMSRLSTDREERNELKWLQGFNFDSPPTVGPGGGESSSFVSPLTSCTASWVKREHHWFDPKQLVDWLISNHFHQAPKCCWDKKCLLFLSKNWSWTKMWRSRPRNFSVLCFCFRFSSVFSLTIMLPV